MQMPMRLVVVALFVGCAAGPEDESDDASNDPCVPGQSIACECDDGSPGARVCEPDGVGYAECVCEGEDDDGESASGSASASGNDSASAGDDDDGANDAGDDDPTDPSDPTDPTDPSGAEDSGDSSGDVPDFQNDIVPIFQVSCGSGSNLCHARNAYFPKADEGCRGWLSLENQPLGSFFDDLDPDTQMESEGPVDGCEDKTLHERLMLLAPWECGAEARYITPFSLEQSYIWLKLTDGTICGNFRVMPPPNEGFEVTPAQKDMLEAWILAGAPQ